MVIYYFMFEAKPKSDNPESNVYDGGFINCWVNSKELDSALTKAKNYINIEGWEVISIEDQFIASRKQYEGDIESKESLACFDQAMSDGVAIVFYTWSDDD